MELNKKQIEDEQLLLKRRHTTVLTNLKHEKSCILEEIECAKLDTRVLRVDNVLEKNPLPKNEPNIISPCFGDPCYRDVLGGGFLTDDNFVKPNEFHHFDEYSFQCAGPRKHIAFEPKDVKAVIVTCGGLCPGLNVVIRELVMSLYFNYGVRSITGIKFGYAGFEQDSTWIEFTPKNVSEIHTLGGTILGSSRGGFDQEKIVDRLVLKGVNMVFAIGGDGTHRAIAKLSEEINKRGLKIGLAGIPKTIDNDIPLIDRSFGFVTSVEEAVKVIESANVEASCVPNGVGLVKIFGRSCGFIAMQATNSSRNINICLIPEAPICLYGDHGVIEFIFKRLKLRGHCVIIVAEGAGSAITDLKVGSTGKFDKSGNPILPDIGVILKQELNDYAKKNDLECNIKYIDPTYIIRSCKANAFDTNLCTKLAQNAVHSVFSGFTNFTTGFIHRKPVLIPVDYISNYGTRGINVKTDIDYLTMMASTGQASFSSKTSSTSTTTSTTTTTTTVPTTSTGTSTTGTNTTTNTSGTSTTGLPNTTTSTSTSSSQQTSTTGLPTTLINNP